MKVLVLTHHRLINNFNGAVTRIRSLAEQLAHQGAQSPFGLLSHPGSHRLNPKSLFLAVAIMSHKIKYNG